MKKIVVVFLVVIGSLFLTSCIPLMIGGLVMKSNADSNNRAQFIQHFNDVNVSRESRGLKPLDWCTELIKYDKGWAQEEGCL